LSKLKGPMVAAMLGPSADSAVGAEQLSVLLRRWRLASGLSQEALAEQAGLSVKAIAQLETGKRTNPHASTIRMLSDALGLDTTERAELALAAHRHRYRPSTVRQDSQHSAVQRTLPVPKLPLIGRSAALAQALSLLQEQATPLLTLTGTGGVGKTRLAIAIASTYGATSGKSVSWVELAPVSDPSLVPNAVAKALGVREDSTRTLVAGLTDVLRHLPVLLVLDNCEHVQAAAGELAAELLEHCPDLQILATSRAPLRIRCETVFPVVPMPLPGTQVDASLPELETVEAVALFLQFARFERPELVLTDQNAAAVAAICHRLDGLPLAMELAASRLRVLSPSTLQSLLEERLRLLKGGPVDAPARQQTLRATVAWSYQLLTSRQQRLFRHLAVFAGGCTLEAVSGVAEHDDPIAVLEDIEALVDQSLLEFIEQPGGQSRYRMLETIREYALERLAASGEEPRVRRRYAEHFAAMAERAEAYLHGPDQNEWLRHLTSDHDNFRSVLSWAERSDTGDPVLGLRVASALTLFWIKRGHFREGFGWIERGLARASEASLPITAKALFGASSLAGWLNDLPTVIARAETSLALYQQLGDQRGEGRSLSHIGLALLEQGAVERAIELIEQALRLNELAGDDPYTALDTSTLGMAMFLSGDHEQGLALGERALELQRECGEHWGVNMLRPILASMYFAHGNVERAASICVDLLGESIEEDLVSKNAACIGLACIAWRLQRFDQAARFVGVATALTRRTGVGLTYGFYLMFPQVKEEVRSALGEAAFARESEAGAGMSHEQLVAEADALLDSVG
jgi:predicted ATPase/DNA-binding XRE family transcriptional regulator